MNVLNPFKHIKPILKYSYNCHLLGTQIKRYPIRRTLAQQSIYLVDETNDNSETETISSTNKYTNRTVNCGELNINYVGQRVTLCGWLEFKRMEKFLVLRDAYGETQLLIKDDANVFKSLVHDLNYESVLEARGTVVARPKDMINEMQTTGEVEVVIEDLQVRNAAEHLPFNIREYQRANEALRMQYRYLDIRFSDMQKYLRFRSELCMNFREFLIRHSGFVDVETPTLFKATPGGAQEFVVPTRHKDKYYSLVQSPQQFKQMLMCGGIDRYFQIARCYRDETSRPDRQPEFTQLDIEMSYTTMEGVMELIEDMFQYACSTGCLEPVAKKFPRMKYNDVMNTFGCDKPDVRFGNEILDCTELLNPALNQYGVGKDFYAGCVVFHEGHHNIKFSGKSKEAVNKDHYPNTRMAHIKCSSIDDFNEKMLKHIPDENVVGKLGSDLQIVGPSSVFLVYGDRRYGLKRLGKLRQESAAILADRGIEIYKSGLHFLWIVDFPLFSNDEEGRLTSEHHPFTSPHMDDLHLLSKNPLQVRALSYDLVLNGNEVGGGSIRIHNPQLQRQILEKLNIHDLDHIIEMLSYGCPPHGGIALGLDRLFACILQTSSIRDVIAFPKTFDGKDPVSGAPSSISSTSRKLYHL